MKDKILREFEVNIIRLSIGLNKLEFNLSDEFFSAFPESIIKEGKGKAFLELDKSETMLRLGFQIELEVKLTCDISLEPFNQEIKVNKDLIVKFGDEDMELSEDVIIIKRDTQIINIADYIYEFTNLEIPMKKVHPKLRDQERPDLVYQSSDSETNSDEDETIDPRWEALKKLKK